MISWVTSSRWLTIDRWPASISTVVAPAARRLSTAFFGLYVLAGRVHDYALADLLPEIVNIIALCPASRLLPLLIRHPQSRRNFPYSSDGA